MFYRRLPSKGMERTEQSLSQERSFTSSGQPQGLRHGSVMLDACSRYIYLFTFIFLFYLSAWLSIDLIYWSGRVFLSAYLSVSSMLVYLLGRDFVYLSIQFSINHSVYPRVCQVTLLCVCLRLFVASVCPPFNMPLYLHALHYVLCIFTCIYLYVFSVGLLIFLSKYLPSWYHLLCFLFSSFFASFSTCFSLSFFVSIYLLISLSVYLFVYQSLCLSFCMATCVCSGRGGE